MRLIDADAIQIPNTWVDMFENCRNCKLLDEDQVREIINNAPTIEPKRGEWELFYESKDGDNVYKCSCCRFLTVIPEGIKLFSFCPHCGADMRKESE